MWAQILSQARNLIPSSLRGAAFFGALLLALATGIGRAPGAPEVSLGQRVFHSCDGAEYRAARFLGKPSPDPTKVHQDPPEGFDDGGLSYLCVVSYLLEPDMIGVPSQTATPKSFFWIINIFLFSALALLIREVMWIWGRGEAGILTALLVLSPSVLAVGKSGDVYLFPLYAAASSLFVYRNLTRVEPCLWKAALGVLGIILCAYFRSNSWLVFPAILAAAGVRHGWDRKRIRNLLVVIGVFVVFFGAYKKTFKHNHPVWHSAFVGLMEFGGWVDKDSRIHPVWTGVVSEPGWQWFPGWNDWQAYNFVKANHPGTPEFSKEYEAVLRAEFLRISGKHFVRTPVLIGLRFWNSFQWDSWRWDIRVSDTVMRDTWSEAFRVAILMLLVWGVFVLRFKLILPLLLWGALMAPQLLVYSSSLVFGAPAMVALQLMGAVALVGILKRLKGATL